MTYLNSSGWLAGILALCALASTLKADDLQDLSSPDPAIRESAAARLRAHPVDLSRSRWEPAVAQIKKDMQFTAVQALFPGAPFTPSMGAGSGNASTVHYRLDSGWLLRISAVNRNGGQHAGEVYAWALVEDMETFYVAPPAGFTGVWNCYYANGNLSGQSAMQNGKEVQGFSYKPDGKLRSVYTYPSPGEQEEYQSTSMNDSGGIGSIQTVSKKKGRTTCMNFDSSGFMVSNQMQSYPAGTGTTPSRESVELFRESLHTQQERVKATEAELAAVREAQPSPENSESAAKIHILEQRLERMKKDATEQQLNLTDAEAARAAASKKPGK